MKIGGVQFNPKIFEVEENLERALKLVEGFEGDLVIFPELAFSGYLFNSKEEITRVAFYNGTIEKKMMDFSEKHSCAVVYGYAEREGNIFYNSSMLIFPSGKKRVYRKTHLFFEEKKLFQPGNTGFFVEEFRGVRIGLAVCFDWFFPESFRTLALLGADVIAHSANLVMPYCQGSNVYTSIQNRVYIATANRWGEEENNGKRLTFTGQSQVTSPRGNILVRGPVKGDVLLTAEIDPQTSRDKNINEFNDIFKDRRSEFYLTDRVR